MLMKYTIDKYIIRVLYDRLLLQNRKNDFDIPEREIFLRAGKIQSNVTLRSNCEMWLFEFCYLFAFAPQWAKYGYKNFNKSYFRCVFVSLIWQFWPIVKSTKMNLFFRNSKILNKFRFFFLLVPHWECFAQCGLEWRYITSLFKNMRFMLDKKALSKVFDKYFFNLCLFYFLQE